MTQTEMIFEILKEAEGGLTAKEVAKRIGATPKNASAALSYAFMTTKLLTRKLNAPGERAYRYYLRDPAPKAAPATNNPSSRAVLIDDLLGIMSRLPESAHGKMREVILSLM